MTLHETIGWVAASLTLLAFVQRSMLRLRLAAIGANAAFVTYGLITGLLPILALHLTLLPCNLYRLGQMLIERRRTAGADSAAARPGVEGTRAADRPHAPGGSAGGALRRRPVSRELAGAPDATDLRRSARRGAHRRRRDPTNAFRRQKTRLSWKVSAQGRGSKGTSFNP